MKTNFNFAFGNAQRWEKAHCITIPDPDYFFPTTMDEIAAAEPIIKRICSKCPVRIECLEMALENQEVYGYFGGVSPEERRKMSSGRNSIGRPSSKEVIRLMDEGWSLKAACGEVGIKPESFIKWKKNETKTTKDKDKS